MEGSAQLLGQQQLLEPGAARRIIVPVGHGAWWGVDPSTTRIALAWASLNDAGAVARGVRTAPFTPGEGPARLSSIYAQTRRFVTHIATCCPWPGVVLIEQPSGRMNNPALSYAVGVIQTAVYDALTDVCGRPVQIETCTSSWWKRRACGRGDIYKPKPTAGTEYGVLTWARQNGYPGSSWDEADALGIAEAARREIELVPR